MLNARQTIKTGGAAAHTGGVLFKATVFLFLAILWYVA